MNERHIVGKKKNRLGRLKKRLSDKELTAERRLTITQRISDLERELK